MLLRSLLRLEADATNRELRLFQSWRGATAAEVLRREGDLTVNVRL